MSWRPILCSLGVIFSLLSLTHLLQASAAHARPTTIVSPPDASWAEQLATREVRRYIYLRTGQLLPMLTGSRGSLPKGNLILVGRKDRPLIFSSVLGPMSSLAPQSFWLTTFPRERSGGAGAQVMLVAGGDDTGVLYAAYALAEELGVRFYLHGDVVPDEPKEWKMPILDHRASPLFPLRGIQPFHDFPEGPDWWNRDEYLSVLSQLLKLRMNFLGLHTYPEERPNAEPTVWIGQASDAGQQGRARFSYPSSYMNTLRGNWGCAPEKTSDYVCGSAGLFERDDYGPEVMFGFMPFPTTPDASNEVFNRAAALLRDAFAFARQAGVKTCVGTETPLVVPKLLQQRLKEQGKNPADPAVVQELYEGIFRRAAAAYPLDYYWFWTPEGWTWSGVKEEEIKSTLDDLARAIAARGKVEAPFKLATCGWVLGPPQDRAMFDKMLPKDVAVSCINRQVGYTPVDAGFAEVQGRSKWAIPWMEDDPALSSPQLWVGRMRRDAADALRYGCDGLMGIHWRTRPLGPNVSALAQAAWRQSAWADHWRAAAVAPCPPRTPGPVGGQTAAYPNNPIADTSDAPLYQTVRYNLSAYHLRASNGLCRVTLKFCEPHYNAPGVRVFDVKLQGRTVLTNLDIFARVGKNRALDYTYTDVVVTNGWVSIDFVPRVEFPCIAAIALEGDTFTNKVNCGGPAYRDYAADAPATEPPKAILPATDDFYADWAAHEFGPEVGPAAAAIFQKIDCNLPKPCTWVDGPGGIQPDKRPWDDVRKDYSFVDEFAALCPRVRGPGNRERYDYWLNTFLYLRTVGEVNCTWAEYNRVVEKVKRQKDAAAQKEMAHQLALPLRVKLVGLIGVVFDHLLGTVSTTGELGTVANWNQHNLPGLLAKPGEELAKLLGEPLPANAQLTRSYHGPTRIIVPTNRTSLAANEALKLKVIVLAQTPPRAASLHCRKLGERRFAEIPLTPVARGVYAVQLPAADKGDFEYYLQAETEAGKPVYFPATAPKCNQTVVRYAAAPP
jgi:hypothetical protein